MTENTQWEEYFSTTSGRTISSTLRMRWLNAWRRGTMYISTRNDQQIRHTHGKRVSQTQQKLMSRYRNADLFVRQRRGSPLWSAAKSDAHFSKGSTHEDFAVLWSFEGRTTHLQWWNLAKHKIIPRNRCVAFRTLECGRSVFVGPANSMIEGKRRPLWNFASIHTELNISSLKSL